MMLEFLGEDEAAARIHKAKELELSVVRAMADGYATSHRAVREQAAAILPKANRR